MTTRKSAEIRELGRHFAVEGQFVSAESFGTGHINDSYAAVYSLDGEQRRYLLQRINQHVFKSPPTVMENIERVTAHLHSKLATAPTGDVERRALTIVPTLDGRSYRHVEGEYWRAYEFIEGARSYEVVRSPAHAEACARAYGHFQLLLNDLPEPRLIETIPNFL